jgi:hypothetical protein
MPEGITLYKYYPSQRIDNLERRMIYFAHPSVFNDPFELQPYFRLSVSEKLHEVLALDPGRAPRPLPEAYLRLATRSKLERAKLEDENKHTLIFSTARERDHLLMWAHYAEGHAGFSVGFDSDHKKFHTRLDGVPRKLQRVNYSTLRPSVDMLNELREQEMLLTKSVHWQHEREWRMFESPFNSDENDPIAPHVWGFRLEPETMQCVILGARITEPNEGRIREVLADPDLKHVPLFKVELDREEFELRIVPVEK